jgi:hypothetical protein
MRQASRGTVIWERGPARELALDHLAGRRIFELPRLVEAMPHLIEAGLESKERAVEALRRRVGGGGPLLCEPTDHKPLAPRRPRRSVPLRKRQEGEEMLPWRSVNGAGRRSGESNSPPTPPQPQTKSAAS